VNGGIQAIYGLWIADLHRARFAWRGECAHGGRASVSASGIPSAGILPGLWPAHRKAWKDVELRQSLERGYHNNLVAPHERQKR